MEIGKSSYYLDIAELVLICLVSLLIPIYIWYTPIIIAILGFLFLMRPRNYAALKESAKTLGFWAMIIPFALYIIGIFYSDDKITALHNTETALSLLAFPFIATAFRENRIQKKLKFVEISLIVGVFAVMIYSILAAKTNYAETHNVDVFFYTSLIKSPHHHSYYVLFALILVTHSLINEYTKKSKLNVALDVAVSIILIGFIGLLSSKITILILAFYIIYIIARMLVSRQIPKWISIVVIVLTLATIPILYSMPMVKFRIDKMIESIHARQDGVETIRTRTESTTIRIKCMGSAIDVISENWLFGTGQGDVYAEFQKKMKLRMGDDYEGTCASHNQFLRSLASFGIMGIASLLLLFFAMFRTAIKSRNATMVWWCVICLCFFCIEDMFCIINGVIFFCLFTGIMMMGKKG